MKPHEFVLLLLVVCVVGSFIGPCYEDQYPQAMKVYDEQSDGF
jgi:hypothetical protein